MPYLRKGINKVRRMLEKLWSFFPTPLKKAISSLVYFFTLLCLLYLIAQFMGLNVSIRETVINVGNWLHISIEKKNELRFCIGHDDSATKCKEDNNIINQPGNGDYVKVYFGIINPSKESIYTSVKIFITFLDNAKINCEVNNSKNWTMFKAGHFKYVSLKEVLPNTLAQVKAIYLKFPTRQTYKVQYALYAEGYKPKIGYGNIEVQ